MNAPTAQHLLAEVDHRHLDALEEEAIFILREVAAAGWKSGVEVAKQLPDLYDAPDKALARPVGDLGIPSSIQGVDRKSVV